MKDYIMQNIKYLRELKKIKGKDLADVIGKTSSTITDYEKGKSVPPVRTLMILASHFDVPLSDIVYLDLKNTIKSKKENKSNIEYGYIKPLGDKIQEMDDDIEQLKSKVERLLSTSERRKKN